MPKPIYKIPKYDLDCLKKSLLDKIGYPITTKKDCEILSEVIRCSNAGFISAATLYRLLLAPPRHFPYLHTLNILSIFLGYTNWHDFQKNGLKSSNMNTHFVHNKLNQHKKDNLLFHCLKNDSLKPIHDHFREVYSQENYASKCELAINLFDSLLKNESNYKFFEEFSGDQFVRKYFFEECFDPCFRITGYEFGLEQYINNIESIDSVEGFQDYIFANAVLLRHHFLRKNTNRAKEIASKLYVKLGKEMDEMKSIHTYPYARYISYKLFYLKISNAPKQSINSCIEFILNFCHEISEKKYTNDSKIVFHTVAETFTKIGLQESVFVSELKEIFKNELENLPVSVFQKKLPRILPYVETNGLMFWRPE